LRQINAEDCRDRIEFARKDVRDERHCRKP
jgi:hypothetical protein